MNILAVIRSKIKNMDYATKCEYFFFRPCGILFLILLVLKITTIINIIKPISLITPKIRLKIAS